MDSLCAAYKTNKEIDNFCYLGLSPAELVSANIASSDDLLVFAKKGAFADAIIYDLTGVNSPGWYPCPVTYTYCVRFILASWRLISDSYFISQSFSIVGGSGILMCKK